MNNTTIKKKHTLYNCHYIICFILPLITGIILILSFLWVTIIGSNSGSSSSGNDQFTTSFFNWVPGNEKKNFNHNDQFQRSSCLNLSSHNISYGQPVQTYYTNMHRRSIHVMRFPPPRSNFFLIVPPKSGNHNWKGLLYRLWYQKVPIGWEEEVKDESEIDIDFNPRYRLLDESYHMWLLVRNPYIRLLSIYLEKVLCGDQHSIKGFRSDANDILHIFKNYGNLTFEEFVISLTSHMIFDDNRGQPQNPQQFKDLWIRSGGALWTKESDQSNINVQYVSTDEFLKELKVNLGLHYSNETTRAATATSTTAAAVAAAATAATTAATTTATPTTTAAVKATTENRSLRHRLLMDGRQHQQSLKETKRESKGKSFLSPYSDNSVSYWVNVTYPNRIVTKSCIRQSATDMLLLTDPTGRVRTKQFPSASIVTPVERAGRLCTFDHHTCIQAAGLLKQQLGRVRVLRLEEQGIWFHQFADCMGINKDDVIGDEWMSYAGKPCFYTPTESCADSFTPQTKIGLTNGGVHSRDATDKLTEHYTPLAAELVYYLYEYDFIALGYKKWNGIDENFDFL